MATLAELETELGLATGTLTGNATVATKWNGILMTAEEGSRKLAEAQALQQTIDQQIAKFGVNESTVIQLQSQIAALKAAHAELEKNGIKLDLKIPELPAAAVVDPVKNLETLIVRGFTNINEASAANNRHMLLFGKPMPDEPSKLADEAAQRNMTVSAWADQKYGFQSEQKKQADAAQEAHNKKIAEAAVAEYREKNPNTSGHPDLNGGLPSNYPKLPAPRDAKDLREFASLPAREKIRSAMERANAAVKSAA